MDTRFKKGQVPWNKGYKGIHLSPQSEFKKGHGFIPLEKRFWEKVQKTNTCWNWIGGINKAGYGRINVNGKAILAHRLCYEFHKGEIKKGLLVLHKCDNPACVNPKHLWLGTYKENTKDMMKKGRGCIGERASYAKLTYKKVGEIRKMYKQKQISQRLLAKLFKVSQCTINFVVKEKRWSI